MILFPCCFIVPIGALSLALTIFWIWCIIDAATNEPASDPNKLVWVLVVVLAHGIGALIYYLVRRPERIRLYGK